MPFPHFDILVEIYEKDRATREGIKTFVETVQNIEVELLNEPMTIAMMIMMVVVVVKVILRLNM